MEKIIFPMDVLRVTQGFNQGSHKGSLAMDFGGKDTGKDKVYAPFSGTVKRCRQGANGELYLWSNDKVMFADGTVDYATSLFMHDSVFNVKEGQHVSQGQYIYDEGGMGDGRANKFGNHLHWELAKGHVDTKQFKNGHGTYVIDNQVYLHKSAFISDSTIVKDGGGFAWIKAPKEQISEDALTLNSEPLYGSSTSAAPVNHLTGQYFKWSNEVVNGRVRVTNRADRVGVVGQVTGWIACKSGNQTIALEVNPGTWYLHSATDISAATRSGTVKGGTMLTATAKVDGMYKLTNGKYIGQKAVTIK